MGSSLSKKLKEEFPIQKKEDTTVAGIMTGFLCGDPTNQEVREVVNKMLKTEDTEQEK